MNLNFNSMQDMLRKSVAEFLIKECPFEKVKELEESEIGYSPKLWEKIVELGWPGLPFPEQYGGFGGDFTDLIIIQEEMGKRVFPSPFFSTVVQCGYAILEVGTEAQKQELIPKIASGKLLLALAQHENDPGYTKGCIKMEAKAQGDSYVLNGTKMFVLDANIANMLIVAAKPSDADITLFLVDAKDPGLTISKIPTIAMDNTCEVIFKDVKVLKKDILGEPGEGYEILEKVMTKGAIAKAAEMIGGAKVSIDMTAEYAKKRVQYGKPIGGFQIIQHYMANMSIAYDTIYNYLLRVAWMVDAGEDVTLSASVLKAKTNENFKFIVDRAVQIHGGIGTTREYNAALFFRKAKAWEFVCGDTDFHTDKVADRILTDMPEW
ncbi:MAG: acyl-CoA/acyl-ACP dehydrogenase [Proteobacteria bacterium]|nr:acyl-CoA/acyl-ACP dehydrogenase [Pseudomonadota bacterium]MBU4469429.1 acyl-CoA/acyl-ACP dehydrogenase [Pseudomonadota bacterium]MCG2752330.1 acyl-CoA/acyl-ACP dehydrogenase [Desulfobacteraceae bacterium]